MARPPITTPICLLAMALLLLAAGCRVSDRPPAPIPTLTPVTGRMNQPIFVYNVWSSYDELSDNIRLDEALVDRQFDDLVRLRRQGVRFDVFMMDAFWFARDGAYRTWRAQDWPQGPDRWIARCQDEGILPGLWIAANSAALMDVAPAWKDSLDGKTGLCLFAGGFRGDLEQVLELWYGRGIRMFKFDFGELWAAPPALQKTMTQDEIVEKNARALQELIDSFRKRHPDCLFTLFNGFGGEYGGTAAPIQQTVQKRWLDTFDSMYCGDPRPSDVPMASFWRSLDLYTDHMVVYYSRNGVPIERIDNTGCMVGVAGTIYGRRLQAWRGMALLEMARGGWMNVMHGNLELLTDQDGRWLARLQHLYTPLLAYGRTEPFGGIPGRREAYGFASIGEAGSVYTVVNPAQEFRWVDLPRLQRLQPAGETGRILFRDAGFAPELDGRRVRLGPEQLAVVGFGRYASDRFDLGVEPDVKIPVESVPLGDGAAESAGRDRQASFTLPPGMGLRIRVQQFENETPLRVSGGSPPAAGR